MRTINEIIVHCTATRAGQKVTVADVTNWHRKRGFATHSFAVNLVFGGQTLTFSGTINLRSLSS